QQVEILGEYGTGGTAKTDAAGKFGFDAIDDSLGQAVPIVHAGKNTVAMEIFRGSPELRLVPAGSLSGKVVANGRAVKGATVFVSNWYMSGWHLEMQTGADGSYRFSD